MTDPLIEYLDSVRSTPFAWGAHDCAVFAGRWWDGRTGAATVAAIAAFGVRSARAYRNLIRGGPGLDGLIRRVIGEPCDADAAARGDVVLVGRGPRAALGIAVPPVVLVAAGRGFEPVPLASIRAVWKLPCRP